MNSHVTSFPTPRYDKSVTLREKLRQSGLQQFLDQPGVPDVRVISQARSSRRRRPDGSRTKCRNVRWPSCGNWLTPPPSSTAVPHWTYKIPLSRYAYLTASAAKS